MNPAESLKHTKWECKYHVVWIPKYRKKSLYQGLRRYLGELLKDLAAQKDTAPNQENGSRKIVNYLFFVSVVVVVEVDS